MADVDACKRHVAVFAFPYGGHARALLSLTEKLARAAPHVSFSFFTTDKSMESLFMASDNNKNKCSNIKPYVVWDGIPDGDDNGVARGHILEKVNGFLRAGPHNLTEGLSRLPANERVTCVISDVFVTSALEVAQHLGVPWIPLWTSHTCSLAAHFHTHSIRLNYSSHHANIADHNLAFIPGFSHMRFQDLPHDLLIPKDKEEEEEEETEFSKMLASMGEVLPQAKAVVINLYEELDPPSLVQHLRSKLQSLIYVGFPSRSLPQSHTDTTRSLSWLDKQPPLSVAYIALGNIATPHPHELVAIAEALEETEVPFLWSLKDELKACLPQGSIMKGKIVPWAPQTLALDHASVGVFVTHGGSNSINESVSSGVPMICRPYFGDQTMNARMVEAVWEIGVKIEDGVFTKEGLTRSLKLVLEQQQGKVMREKAQALKKIVLEAAGPKGKVTQQFSTLVQLVS